MIWLTVEKGGDLPLNRQIYGQIRQAVLSGRLHGGERLPSTRELAGTLGVSRNVVTEAYDQLLAEGYLVTRSGSGTYVEQRLSMQPEAGENPGVINRSSQEQMGDGPGLPASNPLTDRAIIDFRSGLPCLEAFPQKKWGALLHKTCAEMTPADWSYGEPQGREELRRLLADQLRRTRGVCCDGNQIVITTGAMQALNLVAKLLLPDRRPVVMEDPTNEDVRRSFSAGGSPILPVPVDDMGIRTDLLPKAERPAFIFTTPSHQFPLGGVLPAQRRLELVRYARQRDCFIVEDDYDSEFRYTGAPIGALQGLDPERVIYIGSFSKSLSPALRLGYMVLPEKWVAPCREFKRLSDIHSPSLEQRVMAAFISEGHFGRHVALMKKVYKSRRAKVVQELHCFFGGAIRLGGDAAGLHLVAQFLGRVFDEQTLDKCLAAGVRIYPVEERALRKGHHLDKILLGYGHLDEGRIAEGIKRLAIALGGRSTSHNG
ncbi:aminotransferase class I/II-fold pyridoxal phosphate-dependent enzyme [Heliobacterium undosum]|uniref:Aminotransferase class I/II-fold pyridoxal phosphate-dependent enzyme n=1 Tax=Heliomicrobium undosum TaxID=121734 RepID=A0A845L9U4_9FIRM|nr:PLP-dependent aminotransferase family protein [Heliomicrobium undosum]MZP31400.1 aminotransferase class I/II-fold pyridoxal phosphate-dependent enzyme [Heliomicrobium undosum]